MIEGPLQAIGEAAENLNRFRDAPAGRVRINVLEDAVTLLLDPVMQIFVERYPEVEKVNEVLTMHMGPEYILANISLDIACDVPRTRAPLIAMT